MHYRDSCAACHPGFHLTSPFSNIFAWSAIDEPLEACFCLSSVDIGADPRLFRCANSRPLSELASFASSYVSLSHLLHLLAPRYYEIANDLRAIVTCTYGERSVGGSGQTNGLSISTVINFFAWGLLHRRPFIITFCCST